MMHNNRRNFLVSVTALAAALGSGRAVFAQNKLDPGNPKAKELGYVDVAGKADKVKYPAYADGQNCSNCALFSAKPDPAVGLCELFPNVVVPVGAWCSVWETA